MMKQLVTITSNEMIAGQSIDVLFAVRCAIDVLFAAIDESLAVRSILGV
jgi:hypothetical protein